MMGIRQVMGFCTHVKNPQDAILDGIGLKKTPYSLVTRDGLKINLRCNGGNRYVFYENLIRKDYLLNGQILGQGDTVIDIGAHIGCFTLLAAQVVGTRGRVLSLEPNPLTYQILHENVHQNLLQNNVILRQMAVGGNNGKTKFIMADNSMLSSIYSQIDQRINDSFTVEVEMVSLKQLMDDVGIKRCNLLKIDCEGAEHQILETMTVETAQCIAQISMEVHSISNYSKESLLKNLSRLGYKITGERRSVIYARHENFDNVI